MTRGRLPRVEAVAVVAALAAASLWVYLAGGLDSLRRLRDADPWIVLGMLAITAFSVFVRFLRWQFLLRVMDIRIPIRPSFSMYLASLAGMATPAYVGEVVRVVFLRRRFDVPYRNALTALVFERLLDFAAVAAIALVVADGWLLRQLLVGVLVAVFVAVLAWLGVARAWGVPYPALEALGRPRCWLAALALSLVAWGAAGLVVGASSRAFGVPLDAVTSIRVFSTSTLLGGLSLMPGGAIFVGGSAIVQLQASGLEVGQSVTIVSLMRVATVGVTFLVSSVFLVFQLPQLRRRPAGGPGHFDEISEGYSEQFADHVWNHLLERKTTLMETALGRVRERRHLGLDLGCGLGLQSLEMGRRGYSVVGLDASRGLLRIASERGVTVAAGSALETPFPDASFDFVYCVGVLHHLPGPAAQDAALREVRRILRPGGRLIVHESNPRNPLFRFYMGYVFPLLKTIDEGTEHWIHPQHWAEVEGLELERITYFTFLPDFIPGAVMNAFVALERRLERSRLRSWSVHYMAALRKPES